MRVLVIGGGGQVGGRLVASFEKHGFDVFSTYLTSAPEDQSQSHFLDKTDATSVDSLLQAIHPGVVVDTAALTNVDYCEAHPDHAQRVNAQGTENVALACARIGARVIYLSTDYVFDGGRGNYSENDATNPLNQYGLSKLRGEKSVTAASQDNLVVRSSVVYSWTPDRTTRSSGLKGVNFGTWLVQKLSKGEVVRIVNDQYCSPTLADNLAEALEESVQKDLNGFLHLAGRTRLSRFRFAQKLAEKLGFGKELISPIGTAELGQVAPRPADSSLNVDKARGLGLPLKTVDEALRTLAGQLESSTP